jgi:phage terminase large subunit
MAWVGNLSQCDSSHASTLKIATAAIFAPLLNPSRYKGAHGGRGSGKSHFFASLLIELNICRKLDSVCLRETLKSLEFSVKKLLEYQIQTMNAGAYFEVQDRRILTKRGGVIIFEGMQNHTSDSIKSLEGFDIAWFEEAQAASEKSLDLLRPTIRKPGSELWFSWNPNEENDPIEKLLRGKEPPPDSIVVQANYMDNPWLPDELIKELEYDRKRDIDKFNWIWLGQYRKATKAQIFKNWIVEEFERPDGTIFRFGADWGFSEDPSVLVRLSVEGNRLYIDHEAYMVGCEIVNLPDLFSTVPESDKYFITADSSRPETISHMQKHGYPKMKKSLKGKGSINEGIAFLQSYDVVIHPRCVHTIDEFKNYKWKIDPGTEEILIGMPNDKKNHVIDAVRYGVEDIRRINKKKQGKQYVERVFYDNQSWLGA